MSGAESGEERVIAIANFGEVFADPDARPPSDGASPAASYAAGHKAAWWPDADGYLLVTPEAVDFPAALPGMGGRPARVVVASDPWGRTAARLDEDARLRSEVLRFADGAARVRLLTTVYSDGVRRIAERLSNGRRGCVVGGLPSCPPGLVRYWNTKIGGRDLLRSAPLAAKLLPDSVTCHAPSHAEAMLAGRPPTERYVLKANMGSGGSGVLWLEGGERGVAARLADWNRRAAAERNGKCPLPFDEPLLLEAAVGDPHRNRSLTADFDVEADGMTAFIGASLQVLRDFTRYQGIEWRPGAVAAEIMFDVADVGADVGRVMARRGYCGPFNLDFILTGDGVVGLAEINVRRSAPLDQHLALRRLFGDDWPLRMAFRSWEKLPVADLPVFDGRRGFIVMGAATEGEAAAIAVAPTGEALDALIGARFGRP